MSLSTQEAEDDDQYVLVARMDNVRNLSNILKAIHFKEVSDNGRFPQSQPYRPTNGDCGSRRRGILRTTFSLISFFFRKFKRCEGVDPSHEKSWIRPLM